MNPSKSVSRRQKLDLNRRKIAAISFLSNIQVAGESNLPGYSCLVGTSVLRSYQRNRKRVEDGGEPKLPLPISPEKEATNRPRPVEQQAGSTVCDRRSFSKSINRSAERPWRLQPLQEKVARRKLNYMQQLSDEALLELRERREGSVESLTYQDRTRQHSGNLSENSHSSGAKEVKFVTASEEKKSLGDEQRLVLVSSRLVPFTVFSTIPYHKGGVGHHHHHHHRHHRLSSCRLSCPGRGRGFSMCCPDHRGGKIPTERTDLRHVHESGKRLRHSSGGRPLPAIIDPFNPFELLGIERSEPGQEISYSFLLEPSYQRLESHLEAGIRGEAASAAHASKMGPTSPKPIRGVQAGEDKGGGGGGAPGLEAVGGEGGGGWWGEPVGTPYSPHTLDGWLGAGNHSTYLPFSSYLTSIIEYVRPSDMKKELNEKFREKFPNVELTLSKLRSLKLELRRIGIECEVDTVTIAQAYVYFEKLVLKNIISKTNRKFCAGACLILAAKLNDIKGEGLKNLIERTEAVFRLNRRDLLASEFAILVALEFSLHVPTQEVYPHYQRLLYQT